MTPIVGIIANPVSARDIRRVVANASSLQIADRANILLRVLAALAACGVSQVLMMPERGGIAGHVLRGIARARLQGGHFPAVSWLDMPVTGTAESGVIVNVPAVEMLVALSSAVTFFAPVSVPVVAGHV